MAVRRATGGRPTTFSPPIRISPVGRIVVSGDHAQDRGLAAARGPEQAAIGAIGNLEIDAVDRVDEAVEGLDDASELDMAGPQFHEDPPYKAGTRVRRAASASEPMVPRQTTMMMNEMIVVTVPSA